MSGRKLITSLLALLMLVPLLAAPASLAQDNRRAAAFGIEVRQGRKAMPGVEVRLESEGPVRGTSPEPQVTDAEGRAEFWWLTPGIWRVDLLVDGEVAYFLTVRIDPGRRAEEMGSPARDVDAPDLRWKFFRPEGEPPAPPPPPSPAGTEPETPAAEPEAPAAEPEAAEPPPTATDHDLPAGEEAARGSERPPAEPMAEPEAEAAPPEPGTPEPDTPEMPASETPVPETPAPEPATEPEATEPEAVQPEPEEAVTPEPTPEPAPPEAAAPEPVTEEPEVAEPEAPEPAEESPAEEVTPPPMIPDPTPPPTEDPADEEPELAVEGEEEPDVTPPPVIPEPPPLPPEDPGDDEEPEPAPEPEADAPEAPQPPEPAVSEPTDPETATPEPADPEPAVPEAAVSEPAVPEPEEPPVPRPEPMPAPAAEDAAEDLPVPADREPEPVAEAPVEPAPMTGPRFISGSGAGGDCPECKASESALTLERTVPPGDPGGSATCGPDMARAALEAARRLASRGQGLGPGMPLDGGELSSYTSSDASCQVLGVVLPPGVRYRGYTYSVETGGDAGGPCYLPRSCPVAGALWTSRPVIEELEGGARMVYGVFRNAAAVPLRAKLQVFYVMD